MKWYRKAAEQGHASAQSNLGFMYDTGKGVPQDYGAAMKWYRKAAEQGHAFAQYNLGFMYDTGKGVIQDNAVAHMWWNLAAAQGNKGATKNRDIVAKRMTPADLSLAQRLARECAARKYKNCGKPILQSAAEKPRLAPARPPKSQDKLEKYRVVQLQLALTALSYDPGPADGMIGRRTREAVTNFRRANQLPATGKITERDVVIVLQKAALASQVAGKRKPQSVKMASTGSGFVVSSKGHIVTNYHVIKGCKEVRVHDGQRLKVVGATPEDDLSVLQLDRPNKVAAFRQGRGARIGDDAVVIGFPLQGILSRDPTVTTGTVSALAGLRNDRRYLQITAPVQQGNSGGPLLDQSGNVIGVVTSKLNALKVAQLTGDIPQNVNFAINQSVVRVFLDSLSVPYVTRPSSEKLATADIAANARSFMIAIECWK